MTRTTTDSSLLRTVFLITDGGPTDDWRVAAEAVRVQEGDKKIAFFATGVAGANIDVLSQISARAAIAQRAQAPRDGAELAVQAASAYQQPDRTMHSFLASEPVSERTDDDKPLAVELSVA